MADPRRYRKIRDADIAAFVRMFQEIEAIKLHIHPGTSGPYWDMLDVQAALDKLHLRLVGRRIREPAPHHTTPKSGVQTGKSPGTG